MVLVRLKSLATGMTALGALALGVPASFSAGQDSPPGPRTSPAPLKGVPPAANPTRVDLHGDPLPRGARVRLGTVQHRQESPIYHIRFAPDGKSVVTDGDDGQVRVWDADEGRLIRRLDVGIGQILDFAFSSDGKRVAAVGLLSIPSTGKFITHTTMTDLATGRQVAHGTWEAKDHSLNLALSPDGRFLTITTLDGTVRVLDAMTGVESFRIKLGELGFAQVAFASAGNRIAIASTARPARKVESQIRVFELGTGKQLRSFPEIDGLIEALAISSDGKQIAAALVDKVMLWDVASGGQAELNSDLCLNLAFSTDGRRLAARGDSGTFRLWDLVTGREIDWFTAATGFCTAAAFSPDARTIVSNGGPSALHFWDLEAHRDRFAEPDAHDDPVSSVLVTRDGKTLVTAAGDKTVRLWDLESGRLRKVLRHKGGVRTIALSGDGRSLLADTDGNGFLNLWDLAKAANPTLFFVGYRLVFHITPISLAFSSRADSIMGCLDDGTLRRWDLKERRTMDVKQPQFSRGGFRPPQNRFKSGFFFADGQRLAVIEWTGGGLHVVDLPTGKELYRVARANVAAPSPDERTLAIATAAYRAGREDWVGLFAAEFVGGETTIQSDRGTISLLDSGTGKEKLQVAVAGSEVWALAFSPDGRTLAATTGWRQGQIHLYEAATGKEVRTIASPPFRNSALAFTPDGASLVTGMADTSVLVWDLRSRD
jgi:WD40 repeat protein